MGECAWVKLCDATAYVLVCGGYLADGSGVNLEASTALGMADTLRGLMEARSTRFSRLCGDRRGKDGEPLLNVASECSALPGMGHGNGVANVRE